MKTILKIFLFLSICGNAVAEPTVEQVSEAILHIAYDGMPGRIQPDRGNKVVRDVKARNELASAIVQAAKRYDIPPMLMVSIAYRENSFLRQRIGKLGEKSAFQVVPGNVSAIRRGKFPWSDISEPQCDLDTMDGAALCAAALLRIHVGKCGDLKGAFSLYASGKTCKPSVGGKLYWVVKDRFKIAEYLEERTLAKSEI